MIRALEVEAREGRKIWLRYSDGSAGEVDLSNFAGRGVFQAWDDRGFFEQVHVAPHRAIAWNSEIELCADSLYFQLTGKSVEEMLPELGGSRDYGEESESA